MVWVPGRALPKPIANHLPAQPRRRPRMRPGVRRIGGGEPFSGVLTISFFLFFRRLRPLPFLHSLAEQVLHLAIHAAQLVRSPRFELAPKLGIDSQQKSFS